MINPLPSSSSLDKCKPAVFSTGSKSVPLSTVDDSCTHAEARVQGGLLMGGALQRAIFDSASFSSIATDDRGVIQVFNVGAQRMLGYTPGEVLNRLTAADIADPEDVRQRALALSAEFGLPIAAGFEALTFKASRGSEDVYELNYLRKDGRRLPAMVSVTALRDAGDSIIGFLLIGTDNTVRKQAETERARTDEVLLQTHIELEGAKMAAESANLAKSEFLSNMSHELRSPLNAILGFAQLIETGMPPPTPPQQESVGQILQAGWSLLELINEILDLSLIESGRLSLSLEPLSLAEMLAECQEMVETHASKSGIHISFVPLEAELCVRADRTRAKQVFVNLLSNAIKYNRVGGNVVVSCEQQPSARVRITVRDTGQGLPADKLEQLFEPFNRLGREQGAEEGMGIGLAVSKRLVELMDGSIGVNSTLGVGSAFWVELQEQAVVATVEPDARQLALHDEALNMAPGGTAQRTVLCVEDNPSNMRLVEQLLARRPDLRLIKARDGRTGVELARSARPDVILMDINLPGIGGAMALAILAADPATAHIPVVAVSSNAMPGDIEKGLAAGFFRYLTKPIHLREFEMFLNAALEVAAKPRALSEETMR